jgi:hypothetical protein
MATRTFTCGYVHAATGGHPGSAFQVLDWRGHGVLCPDAATARRVLVGVSDGGGVAWLACPSRTRSLEAVPGVRPLPFRWEAGEGTARSFDGMWDVALSQVARNGRAAASEL